MRKIGILVVALTLAFWCAGLNAQQAIPAIGGTSPAAAANTPTALALTVPAKKNKSMFVRMFARTKSRPTGLEKDLYHTSIVTLWSGAAFDYTETYFNMTHPQNVCGAWTGHPAVTSLACGPQPATNWSYLGNTFIEGGWAKFIGKRDYPGVVGMNLSLDMGIAFTSRWLYRQGGVWRWAGIALNFWHGAVHVKEGFGNVRYDRLFNKNIGIYMPSGFQGPIWWGAK